MAKTKGKAPSKPKAAAKAKAIPKPKAEAKAKVSRPRQVQSGTLPLSIAPRVQEQVPPTPTSIDSNYHVGDGMNQQERPVSMSGENLGYNQAIDRNAVYWNSHRVTPPGLGRYPGVELYDYRPVDFNHEPHQPVENIEASPNYVHWIPHQENPAGSYDQNDYYVDDGLAFNQLPRHYIQNNEASYNYGNGFDDGEGVVAVGDDANLFQVQNHMASLDIYHHGQNEEDLLDIDAGVQGFLSPMDEEDEEEEEDDDDIIPLSPTQAYADLEISAMSGSQPNLPSPAHEGDSQGSQTQEGAGPSSNRRRRAVKTTKSDRATLAAKPISVTDMDSDDEMIWNLRRAGWQENSIKALFAREHRREYVSKSFGTRYKRMKKAMMAETDKWLAQGIEDWHVGDDELLLSVFKEVDKEINDFIANKDVHLWDRVCAKLSSKNPVTNFSAKACKKRVELHQVGTCPVPVEQREYIDEVAQRMIEKRRKEEDIVEYWRQLKPIK